MKDIIIKTIPHGEQRYPTAGDYEEFDDRIEFHISDLNSFREEMALALHEVVEFALCKIYGIDLKVIDTFDILYENRRKPGDFSEPGDAINCPYRSEHRFAENIERMFALEAGVDWQCYDEKVRNL